MKQIPLTKGKFAIVDDEDFHYLNRFVWQYAVDKYGNESVRRSFNHKFKVSHINIEDFILHRGTGVKVFVFKNGNRLDFRKENLGFKGIQWVTHNARKMEGCLSKYKGVSKNLGRKNRDPNKRYRKLWRGQIEKGTRGTPEHIIRVKAFDTELEAVEWWNKQARELYGENAYQNKIEE